MVLNKNAMLAFDKQNQVVSALGAVICLITLVLLGMTAFFVYVVYVKGQVHYKEEAKQDGDREAQYLDDERSVKRAQGAQGPQQPQKRADGKQQPAGIKAGQQSNALPGRGPTITNNNKPVDLDEVDLEYDDGNAKQPSPVKQQQIVPPAKGGLAGVAFQDRLNQQLEEKKRQTAAFEADRIRQQQQQQAVPQKRQVIQQSEEEEEVDEDDEEVEEEEQSSRGAGNNGKNQNHDTEEDYKPQIAQNQPPAATPQQKQAQPFAKQAIHTQNSGNNIAEARREPSEVAAPAQQIAAIAKTTNKEEGHKKANLEQSEYGEDDYYDEEDEGGDATATQAAAQTQPQTQKSANPIIKK